MRVAVKRQPKLKLACAEMTAHIDAMCNEHATSEAARPADAAASRVLVENHREFLRFLERRVGSREVAEDILQEAFARGLKKLETLRDDEAVVPWFYRTLRNAAVDYFRRTKVQNRALAQFSEEVETAEEAQESVRAEACRCVLRLADTLKPEYAEAVRRIEVDGVSITDFAEEQGISKNNAAVRVFRARDALRRQLAVFCGTCAEHGCFACTCGTSTSLPDDRSVPV